MRRPRAKVSSRGIHFFVAEEIRKQLRRHGMEQYRLADKAKVARSHLSRLLNLQQSPTLGTLHKLALACEIRVKDLLP